jgi:quercetin dioxygenase-like cupin family protein
MPPLKTFHVFGERVDVLVDTATSNGTSATVVQHVPPGGGPPAHSHSKEEETFTVLEGDFEILS